MTPPIPTAFDNSRCGPREASLRPSPDLLPLANHVNPQTREDGSYLLGAANLERPQVRLPPLDRFDEFTIRQLYSPIVADMTRMHSEIVSWIGESAIEMIESLATREYILENEILREVAEMRLKVQVIKAELGEKRSRQLQQEALKELKSIKRELDTMPQSPFTGPEEQAASTAISSPRSHLPQDTALAIGDPISMNTSQSHSYDVRGNKANLNILPDPGFTFNSSPEPKTVLTKSQTHINGFPRPYLQTNGPFGAYSEGRTFLNCGPPEFDFANESARPFFKPSPFPSSLPSIDGKSRQDPSPRETIMSSPAQYNSSYRQERPLTASPASDTQDLTSGGINVMDFGNRRSAGSVPRNHQNFRGISALQHTSNYGMPPSEARTLTVGKQEQISKRKNDSNVGNGKHNHHDAKKVKIG